MELLHNIFTVVKNINFNCPIYMSILKTSNGVIIDTIPKRFARYSIYGVMVIIITVHGFI